MIGRDIASSGDGSGGRLRKEGERIGEKNGNGEGRKGGREGGKRIGHKRSK